MDERIKEADTRLRNLNLFKQPTREVILANARAIVDALTPLFEKSR